MLNSIFKFNFAIVRHPSNSVVRAIRKRDFGNPSYTRVLKEHEIYVKTLQKEGLKVISLPPLEDYPDSLFVEDAALVFNKGAIILRSNILSRHGEANTLIPVLNDLFDPILELPRGYVDGGDIINSPNEVIIGLSTRTDLEGAEALVNCLKLLNIKGSIVTVPESCLHLKSNCSLLDNDTILASAEISKMPIFKSYKKIITPVGEEGAANSLRINDTILVGSKYVQTIKILKDAEYKIIALPVTEIDKVDGGLSCMSLRWA